MNPMQALLQVQTDLDRERDRLWREITQARHDKDWHTHAVLKHRNEGLQLAFDIVHRRICGVVEVA